MKKTIFTNHKHTNYIKHFSHKFNTHNQILLIRILLRIYLVLELDLQLLSNGELKDNLISEFGLTSSVISQFGYQFEKQIMGDENVAGLVEGIIFLGGLEYGLFLPSLSGMFGARFSSGYEFAVGPNLSLGGAGLVIGFGKTIQAGNINIPINFAWVPSTSRLEYKYNF